MFRIRFSVGEADSFPFSESKFTRRKVEPPFLRLVLLGCRSLGAVRVIPSGVARQAVVPQLRDEG